MSRRSKPSGSAAPAPAVIRYLSRRPPVEVRMRIREATFSAAWARSSMGIYVLGEIGRLLQTEDRNDRLPFRPDSNELNRTNRQTLSQNLFGLPPYTRKYRLPV